MLKTSGTKQKGKKEMTSTSKGTWNILHDDKSRFFLRYGKSISDKYWDLFFNIAHVFEQLYISEIYTHFETKIESCTDTKKNCRRIISFNLH